MQWLLAKPKFTATLTLSDEMHNYFKRTNKYWMRTFKPHRKTANLLRLVSFEKGIPPSFEDVPLDVCNDGIALGDPVAVDLIVQPSLIYQFALNETNSQGLPVDSQRAASALRAQFTVSAM